MMRLDRLMLNKRQHAIPTAKTKEAYLEERYKETEEYHDCVGLIYMP